GGEDHRLGTVVIGDQHGAVAAHVVHDAAPAAELECGRGRTGEGLEAFVRGRAGGGTGHGWLLSGLGPLYPKWCHAVHLWPFSVSLVVSFRATGMTKISH